MMGKKFLELRAALSEPAHQQAAFLAKAMLTEKPLDELWQARGLSQKMLAEVPHVK